MRSAVGQAKQRWPEFSADQAWSHSLRRAEQYSLNFYLHREVPDWSEQRQGWIFGAKRMIGDYWSNEMDCLYITHGDAVIQIVVCKNSAEISAAHSR